ncbi:MAG: hypothetical protein ACJA1A_002479 [Saprospiraceae bacterium]|jgi:hypothetical protein
MNRDEVLLKIRPKVATKINYEISSSEAFQNKTLRPILKFQNDLIVYLFWNSKTLAKINFDKKDVIEKKSIIADLMKNDQKLKDQIEACVYSFMTSSELDYYFENRSEMKRRSNTMVIERLIDNLA